MTAYGLKEYELEYAGFHSRRDLGFIVGHVAKPLAPQMSEVTQPVPGKYGNIYTGTNYEALVFNIPITILADTAQEYNSKIENIRNAFINLYEDKNKEYPLIFGDRPEVMYYGHWSSLPDPQFMTENDWDTQTTLQFSCSDPYGYLDQEQIHVNQNNEAIYPKGNGYTYPIYVMKLKKDVYNLGYADQHSSQYVATGYTVDIDNTDEFGNKITNKEPLVINEPETDLSSWSTDDVLTHSVKIDNGEVDGELDMYAGWGLAPKRHEVSGLNGEAEKIKKQVFNFGKAKNHKNWYGPMAVHDNVPNPTSDWQIGVTLRHAQQYQRAMGKLEIYLLDENNKRRGKIWIKDQSHGRIPHIGIQLGTDKKNVEILKKDKDDGSDDSSNDYVGPKKIPGTDIDWINTANGKGEVILKYKVKKKVSVPTKKKNKKGSGTTKAKTPKKDKNASKTNKKGTTKTNQNVKKNYDVNGNWASTFITTNNPNGTEVIDRKYKSGTKSQTKVDKKGNRTTTTTKKNGETKVKKTPAKKKTTTKRSLSRDLRNRILKRGLNPDDLETRDSWTDSVNAYAQKVGANAFVNANSLPQYKTQDINTDKATYYKNTNLVNMDKKFTAQLALDGVEYDPLASVKQQLRDVEVYIPKNKKGGKNKNDKTTPKPVTKTKEVTKEHKEWYWKDKHSAFTNFCGTFFIRKVGNHFSCWLQMKENEYGMPVGGVMAKRDFYDTNNEFQFSLTSIAAWLAKHNIDDDRFDPPYPYDDNKLAIQGFQYWNIIDGGNQATEERKIIASAGETIYIDTTKMKVYKGENGVDLTRYTSFASSFPPLRGGVYNQLSFEPRPGTEADIYIQYRPRIK